MKKLALLLTALGVVSAAAYAAPELTVTSVGQELEIEHENGTDGTTAWLFNSVGLKYDDWSFTATGAKQWKYSDKNDDVTSSNHRLQFDVAKPVTDNLTLKGRYRGQNNLDRFQASYDYKYGMFLSSGDFFYDSVNGTDHDSFHAEWHPIGVSLGPVQVKYYFEYVKTLGDVQVGEVEEAFDHQIRLYAPLYKGERLTLSTEGRFSFHASNEYNGEANATQKVYDDFGNNRVYLKANYVMTENLNVYANYYYQFRDYEFETVKKDNVKSYTSNLVLGWSYKF
ncbi:DUF2490 domain-containing protein [Fusobacterium perfoetens]|uniref:DUF2490 domain-containing protein n=1 Tax=Fusobacterium perfoetens TaxID=852 RepID=UPI001F39E094|nr:hypothetical protein [Fusobacterium perfoetens]MCF2611436.1 hypothetical protein [Fusobacterium perfoetens]